MQRLYDAKKADNVRGELESIRASAVEILDAMATIDAIMENETDEEMREYAAKSSTMGQVPHEDTFVSGSSQKAG